MQEFIIKNRELGESLYSLYKNSSFPSGAEILPSISGKLTCKIQNTFIHSGYDPVREATHFGDGKIEGKKILFVLGMGLGYHIVELLKKTQALIVVIELCEEYFHLAYENVDLDFLHQVVYYIGRKDGLSNFLSELLVEESCTSAEILPLVSVTRLNPEGYNCVADIINRILSQKIQSYMTTLGFGYRWITNTLKNMTLLDSVISPVSQIKAPVFILASGPSLDKALPYLKLMKRKGLVLCLSHSLARVLEEGFYPDAVLAIDGGYAVHSHFNLSKQDIKSVVLITALSVHPLVIRRWQGPIAIVHIDLPFEETVFLHALKIPVAGTVAATAYRLARKISSAPCYFAGLDLAFTGGRYHHSGSLAEENWIYNSGKLNTSQTLMKRAMRKFRVIEVAGRDGDNVLTNSAMNSYRLWFENEWQGKEIYLLGHEGAEIKNAVVTDFSSLEKLPDIQCSLQFQELEKDKKSINDKVQKIIWELENHNIEEIQDEAIKMQFSRFRQSKESDEPIINKVKMLYRKILNENDLRF